MASYKKRCGYVKAEIISANAERTLRELVRLGAHIKNARRISYTRLVCELDGASYVKAKKLAEVRVLRRGGMMYVLYMLKRRIALVITLMLGAAALCAASTMHLHTEIRGAESICKSDVMKVVLDNGGAPLRFKAAIDTHKIELALRREFETMSYAYAHFEGVKLVIDVDEGTPAPEMDEKSPCSIVAAKDGVIRKLTVMSGEAAVNEGAAVKKGDVLIRGRYTVEETDMLTAAKGIARAEVVYEGVCSEKELPILLGKTGRVHTGRVLRLGNRWISMPDEVPFEYYAKDGHITSAAGTNLPLVLEVWTVKYSELAEVRTIGDGPSYPEKEHAYADAVRSMPEGAEILDISYICAEKDGERTVICRVLAEEDIAERSETANIGG